MHAQRPVHGGRPAACRQSHRASTTPSRTARATSSTRASWRRVARRVQRQGIVRPDAQKTDAKQTNQNLLLSEDAEVDTKPQLEIYADDVKCTSRRDRRPARRRRRSSTCVRAASDERGADPADLCLRQRCRRTDKAWRRCDRGWRSYYCAQLPEQVRELHEHRSERTDSARACGTDWSPGRHPAAQDFPILRQTVHGKPLVYLDNAATSQKPQSGDRVR